MKCFRNALQARRGVVHAGLIVVAVLAAISAGWAAAEWANVEAGSAIEGALYRWMPMPVSKVLGLRPPREAVPLLSDLIRKQPTAELYALRAQSEEASLDFAAAEADWKKYAELASDRVQAQLALADFYHQRLRPAEEIAALAAVAAAPADARDQLLPSAQQRSWQAFERSFTVIRQNALPAEASDRTFRAWIARYPREKSVFARYFQFLLDRKAFAEADKLVTQYHAAFPEDNVFPVKAHALTEYRKGSVEQGLAVYDANFQPLWPPELVQSYFELMRETRSLRKFLDEARAALERNPDDLSAAARIFYYYQQQGRADAAQQALGDFRRRKEQRNGKWAAHELYTLARLHEETHAYAEAARYYYALYSSGEPGDAQARALAGLANLLLEAPEQPLRAGSGELSMYRDIGTMDPGPGFLNGILSLVLNTTEPAFNYSEDEQRAVPYFHRAEAAELIRLLDARFPGWPQRPALHARLIETYANYGESEAVLRDGQLFLTGFPNAAEREQVALFMADAYARTHREQEEFALYDALLAELAKKAEGLPLGAEPGQRPDTVLRPRRNVPAAATPEAPEGGLEEADAESDEDQAAARAQQKVRRAFELQGSQTEQRQIAGVRSPEYARVLERYLSRLVLMRQVPQALAVLRQEIDRNPNDPGLYERLAQFLQMNHLGQEQEQVYQRALQQFGDHSWYHKLARFYLRERRQADFQRLSEQLIKIFSGTELERYFSDVGYGEQYYIRLNEYAHQRFPHDLVFVRNLLGAYHIDTPQWEALLRQNWWAAEDLRGRYFEFLSRRGRLEQELAALQQAESGAQQRHWPELAATNPVAARFIGEAGFWRSHFEEAAPVMGALAQHFPAEPELGHRAAAAYRSLAAFDAKNTERAIAIEENLLRADPGNREQLARMGDILSDRELFERAAPYWERMAQVRPGEPQAYLDAATVYWDYYNFEAALRLLHEGRTRLGDQSLYAYEAGAIYENERDYPKALAEYVKGALQEGERSRSRGRLLELARRPKLREAVDQATASLLAGAAPDLERVKLRVAVLEAQNRPQDLEKLLSEISARTNSLELLEWLEETARAKSLVALQQSVLERQAAVTTDPVRRLELRYALVRFYEANKNLEAAQRNVEALYRENPKILGVVRATVDFYWRNKEKQRALDVLLQAAQSAYPGLRAQFRFEAARKSTDAGQYEAARNLLGQLLTDAPFNDEYLAAVADTYARAGDDRGLKAFYLEKIEQFRKAPLAQEARNRQIAALRRGLIPALTRLQDYVGAVDQYIEIINRYPEDEALAGEAALYAQGHGRQQQVLDFYRATIKQSPRDYRWPMVLARMQAQMEDYPAAINSYGTAINVRPDRVDLRTARAELMERLMRFDDAAGEYQRLFELNYHDPRWLEKVALLRARQGNVPEAVAALQAALIDNRPEKAENYFEVAQRLESWGMLLQARQFAEKGAAAAGRDLLALPEHHPGAELYVRIMTRLRQQDAAYQRLQTAISDATSLAASVGVAVEQVERRGVVSITDQQWRQRELTARRENARAGMQASLRAMGAVVREYFTPEEKVAFAAWLENKAAGNDLELYIAAADSAELADLEARWYEQQMMASPNGRGSSYEQRLIQLQSRRLRFQELGGALERYAVRLRPDYQFGMWLQAAEAYRSGAIYDQELRVLSNVEGRLNGEQLQRYFELLLRQNPQHLLQLAAAWDTAAQYAVLHGDASLAQQAISAHARAQQPVWNSSYTALTALHFGDRSPAVKTAFLTTLGDQTIGERIGKPVDRARQLAGNTWFYYGSRYGEWLGLTGSAEADDFLPAILEQAPASSSGYVTTGEYYADAGKLERAIQEYGHTLELAPGRADIHDRVGVLYWRQQKRGEAVAEFKQALEMLDAQVNQRRVPASFWPTLGYVLNHVGNRHVLAELRPQADAVLRDYVRHNGVYQVDDILREAFLATGDAATGTTWMLDLAAVAPDPVAVLTLLAEKDWIPAANRDPIYQQLLGRLQDRLRNAQGLAGEYAQQEVRTWQLRYARHLIAQSQFDRAAAVLQALPKQQPPAADELELRFRLAIQRNELDAVLEQYRSTPEQAPTPETLRQSATALRRAGLRMPARKILEFVFRQEIAVHQLTPANMLGLAEIRLQDGDTAGAMELLRRLTLVVGAPFVNLDAAASLLARNGHHAEAVEFLAQLAKAEPWNTGARVRLAQEQIAAGTDAAPPRALAARVAGDPAARYADRISAAALAGSGGGPFGSAELELMARGIPNPAAADQPYFYAARLKAAERAPLELREQLLRNAMNDSPERDAARVPLFQALVSRGRDQLAISAMNLPFRSAYRYSAIPAEDLQDENAGENQLPETEGAEPQAPETDGQRLSASDRARLNLAIGQAYARLGELQTALRYMQMAAGMEKTKSRKAEINRNISNVRAVIRRNANNALRAPTIHNELEQEHVVRPRLAGLKAVLPPPARPATRGGAQ